jgi:tape measure domain-containing protein
VADSIDDRVVRMEFDNSQFERKTAETVASLERLNRTLQLEGAKRGFSDVQNAANGVHLDKIGNDVSNISSHFSALSVIATGALLTIGSAAVRTGAQFAKSFTLGPIIDGFKEYETNIGSIQTILANTKAQGTNLNQVNAALNELNTYSDKTIYNFSQMAKNIGTFTAAGVDLKTSTSSIKGIANLAAVSGSSADQASTAMYQLSQAIASGSVKLMDWNSVVNAGMGGKQFQEALFNTGVALGKIKDVPVGETFKQWTDKGNSFRDSLKDGWITADVLTTTLSGAAGELDVAQLKAKGFTDAQAKNLVELGKTGIDAATKVRTLTQLLSTIKEAIGSGWSATFQQLLGNFTEATSLFTTLSNSIGGFIGKNAKYRNDLLKGWTMLGGRFLAFEGIKNVFWAIANVLQRVGQGFRDVFPKTSVTGLVNMTKGFYAFSKAITPSIETLAKIRHIARALFSVLSIGWTIIKEGVKFVKDLVVQFTGLGQGKYLDFFARLSTYLINLQQALVVEGGIRKFFNTLRNGASGIGDILDRVGHGISVFFGTIKGFFGGSSAKAVDNGLGRLGQRFDSLRGVLSRLQEVLHPIFTLKDKILHVLETIMEPIRNWFHELGDSIAKSMHKGDFSKVLDGLNTALLGGIALLIARFMKKGLNFNQNIDIGRGLFQKIGGTFDALTNKLNAMQTEIKANALLKIAAAVGILTASVIALSLIDSAALTKALTAMAVGFGQLMASFALLNKMNINARDAAKFNLIAAAMVILSGAMIVLSIAVKIFASMKPDELVRGLGGITAGLTVLSTAAILISKYSDSFILASIGIVAISGALILLGVAVRIFSGMSWSEMGKGLAGVTGSLVAIALAMQLMPATLPLTAAGLVLVGVALNAIAAAMKIFATMSWKDMGKGLAGVAGSLVVIGLAMQLMPLTLPLTAAGLILVGVALNVIAGAMKIFGTMKWDEIGRGLAGLGGTLLLLALATNAMTGAIVGAFAIVIVAGALVVLAGVIKTFAGIKTGDLVHALIGIAAALAVIGLAAYLLLTTGATVAILALGAALLVLGASFVLVGAGIYLLGKGLAIIGQAGADAAKAIGVMLESIGKNLSKFGTGLAEGVLSFVKSLGEGIPVIVRLFEGIMTQLIASAIKLLPQMTLFIGNLISSIIGLIRAKGPDFIDTGMFILVTLLQGISDNIGVITTSVAGIIFGFLTALSANIGSIVQAGGNLLVQFLYGLALQMPGIVMAVAILIATFLNNLAANLGPIITAGGRLLISVIQGITREIPKIADAITHMIVTFITEVGRHFSEIIDVGVHTVLKFIEGLKNNALQLANGALTVLEQFIAGLRDAIDRHGEQIRHQGWLLAGAIINGMTGGLGEKAQEVYNKVKDIMGGAIDAAKKVFHINSPSKVFQEIGRSIPEGLILALDKDTSVARSSGNLAVRATESFKSSLTKITDGLGGVIDTNPTIKPVLDLSQVQSEADKIAGYISDAHGLNTTLSLSNAKVIAAQVNGRNDPTLTPGTEPKEISFTQINNSPKALSERDIYKGTRNQLAMAKEKLHIP